MSRKRSLRRVLAPLVLAGWSATAAAEPVLESAWVRALPPTQKTTAAYLTLVNDGAAIAVVTGGSSPLAGRVEIHRTRHVEGYTRMEQLDTLSLAPGERLELSPGGTHLMLLDLERMPAAGEHVELCLDFQAGYRVCTLAEVRDGNNDMHHHHH